MTDDKKLYAQTYGITWGILKCVSYKYPDGSPIEHITKGTMLWIG